MNVLLVKLSSLGDIVHTLPAVQDAAQRGARFDWVVEENYRAVPELVAGVDNVLPVALRRWRTAPLAYAGEVRRFLRRLRRRSYDLVLDAQGLVKSAALTRWARARERAGFDAASARERLASLAYGRRLAVGRREHAIVRIRRLFANVLGYPPPRDAPVFGLPVVHQAGCYSMALSHGLASGGHTPDSVSTTATVSLESVEGGFAVTKIHLECSARVPGISRAAFDEKANEAKAGCPISKLMNAEISLNAVLES